MYKTVLKNRLSMTIVNGFFALTMVLGSFAAANAQETGNRVLLPLVQSGSSVSLPVDGPFASVPELPALPDIEVGDALVSEDPVPEIFAASCYGSARTYEIGTGYADWQYFTASRNCRDLNVTVFNWASTGSCYVYVYAYYRDRNGVWVQGSGSDVWIGPDQTANFFEWYEPVVNIVDGTTLALSFYAQPGCGVSEVKVAA